jgi:hypothetical protein
MKKFVLAAVAALLLASPAMAAPCAVSDVSLTINYPPSILYAPARCADGVSQGGGPTAETTSMNTQLGNAIPGIVYLDKSDDPTTPTGLGGISFTVTAGTGNSGDWTVSWAEQPGAPNLPVIVDFEVGLFGGNNGSAYFFDNVILSASPTVGTGTFDINFLNNGGQQPTLSHLLLAGGATQACVGCVPTTTADIPEPMTMALLGSSLIGLGVARRRRR